MARNFDYGDYIAIIYASLQTIGILSTSIYVLIKSSAAGCLERLEEIWSYKWVYVSSLSTIYDQASDIGVIIYWYNLIDKDIENVDMTLLFALSSGFCLLSRIVNIFVASLMVKSCIIGMFAGIFDLLITILVWGKITNTRSKIFKDIAFANDVDEFTIISYLQMFEAIFEALPQILLQSLFLIRTFNNQLIYSYDDMNNYFNVILVWMSLFMSIISATNKISHIAITQGTISQREKFENRYNVRCNCIRNGECPIINIGIVFVKCFYVSNIITRLFIYSLLWSVAGGVFAIIFFIICLIVFISCIKCKVFNLGDDHDATLDSNTIPNSPSGDKINIAMVNVETGSNYNYNSAHLDANKGACMLGMYFVISEAFCLMSNNLYDSSLSISSNENVNIIKRFLIHNLCNFFAILLILYFSLNNDFDCKFKLCAHSKIRNINYNNIVFGLTITVFITLLIQSILFCTIPTFKKLSRQWESNYQNRKKMKKAATNDHDDQDDNDKDIASDKHVQSKSSNKQISRDQIMLQLQIEQQQKLSERTCI